MKLSHSAPSRRTDSAAESFLHAFADIEAALKKRLGRRSDDTVKVSEMIRQYRERNPCWIEASDELLWLAEVRNLLTHKRNSDMGYPVAVSVRLVTKLRRIREEILHPEPVSSRFRREVHTVSLEDSLASVAALAYRMEFSQFPVLRNGRFAGLITENEITRWLGHRAENGKPEIDLKAITVAAVLKEKEPHRGAPIFQFAGIEDPILEVMSLFLAHPALEVVLLTASGSGNRPLEGIVTQWDAARYSHGGWDKARLHLKRA